MSDETFVIKGVEFSAAGFPRPFTMDERTIMIKVYEEAGVDEAQQGAVDAAVGPSKAAEKSRKALEKQFAKARTKAWPWDMGRVEKLLARLVKAGAFESDLRTDLVQSMDAFLSAEYERDFDSWDEEKIASLDEALTKQQEILSEVRTADLTKQMQLAEERQATMEGVLEVMDRANMTLAYEVGRFNHLAVNGYKTFMRRPSQKDYTNADKLAQEGKRFGSLERRMKNQADQEQPILSLESEPTPREGTPGAP